MERPRDARGRDAGEERWAQRGAELAAERGAGEQPGAAHARRIRRAFSEIAPSYDLLNHLLSLNADRAWRRRAVDLLGWERVPGGHYLDCCAGTFDLSLELARRRGFQGQVLACDFAQAMLAEGLPKLGALPVRAVCADALQMPFRAGSFAGAMVAFGVRNLASLGDGLGELARMLRPGGRLVILEFTVPPNRALRQLYLFYFRRVLPLVGRVVSGHPWAYSYLPASVLDFPGPGELARQMMTAGLGEVRWELLWGGIAAIHVGTKPADR
ncbi:MAG: ubiquinone/menaquinone biosynthesis methyltransferase [Gemmatimonadetes bacterium]|nr:ubiquinone/menaquinone biosynthesis methyltransferase [Gemmatimonadota bacterium]